MKKAFNQIVPLHGIIADTLLCNNIYFNNNKKSILLILRKNGKNWSHLSRIPEPHFGPCTCLACFQNGDYNKPIPAQFSEHLNHGVSAGMPLPETPKTLQWVNCQMLLCKKCNNNQSVKIKQLASFIPREDVSSISFFYCLICGKLQCV